MFGGLRRGPTTQGPGPDNTTLTPQGPLGFNPNWQLLSNRGGNFLGGQTVPQGTAPPAGNPFGTPQGFDPSGHMLSNPFFGMSGRGFRPIGGPLNFSGGRGGYNNGVGAGTGFGAFNIINDRWGEAAGGFGVGVGGASSPSSYAVSDAQRSARLNRV